MRVANTKDKLMKKTKQKDNSYAGLHTLCVPEVIFLILDLKEEGNETDLDKSTRLITWKFAAVKIFMNEKQSLCKIGIKTRNFNVKMEITISEICS